MKFLKTYSVIFLAECAHIFFSIIASHTSSEIIGTPFVPDLRIQAALLVLALLVAWARP